MHPALSGGGGGAEYRVWDARKFKQFNFIPNQKWNSCHPTWAKTRTRNSAQLQCINDSLGPSQESETFQKKRLFVLFLLSVSDVLGEEACFGWEPSTPKNGPTGPHFVGNIN